MRGETMDKICQILINEGHELHKFSALDFFAREGDWQTVVYAKKVGAIEAWEIESSFLPGLKKNLPGAKIRIVDSYEYGMQSSDRFDFVVLDNPQATFGPHNKYCEHFEALPVALHLMKPNAFLIFNINWAPYNFDSHPDWQQCREEFYQLADTSSLSIDRFLLPFYENYFSKRGFKTLQHFSQPRNDEFLSYAVFQLAPK